MNCCATTCHEATVRQDAIAYQGVIARQNAAVRQLGAAYRAANPRWEAAARLAS